MKQKRTLSKQIRMLGNKNYGIRNLKFSRMKDIFEEFFELNNKKDLKIGNSKKIRKKVQEVLYPENRINRENGNKQLERHIRKISHI